MEMYEHNLASLAKAIYVYHGTTYYIAQELGLKSRQVSREFYTRTKTKVDHKKLCLIHKKSLPLKELYALNLRGLAHAILKYKGFKVIRNGLTIQVSHMCQGGLSIYTVKKKTGLNYQMSKLPQGHYTVSEVVAEYKKLCKKMVIHLAKKSTGSTSSNNVSFHRQNSWLNKDEGDDRIEFWAKRYSFIDDINYVSR